MKNLVLKLFIAFSLSFFCFGSDSSANEVRDLEKIEIVSIKDSPIKNSFSESTKMTHEYSYSFGEGVEFNKLRLVDYSTGAKILKPNVSEDIRAYLFGFIPRYFMINKNNYKHKSGWINHYMNSPNIGVQIGLV